MEKVSPCFNSFVASVSLSKASTANPPKCFSRAAQVEPNPGDARGEDSVKTPVLNKSKNSSLKSGDCVFDLAWRKIKRHLKDKLKNIGCVASLGAVEDAPMSLLLRAARGSSGVVARSEPRMLRARWVFWGGGSVLLNVELM